MYRALIDPNNEGLAYAKAAVLENLRNDKFLLYLFVKNFVFLS
jgi:hypothetical protein